MNARKQHSELQDEYGIDNQEEVDGFIQDELKAQTDASKNDKNNNNTTSDNKNIRNQSPLLMTTKLNQQNRLQQQQIRRSDHDDSDSDSDTDEKLEDCENKKDYYNTEEFKINEDDQKAFDLFMSNKPVERRTVAEIILEKLAEKKSELQTQLNDNDDNATNLGMNDIELDERIVRMYTQIKEVLKKYRSGKLPKAFKILPSLANWEHVI
jgi:hypothetical protein